MDSGNKQNQDSAESQVADLVILVSRLIHQVNRLEPNNPTVDKAMDYLRRKDLIPSILRGINEHTMKRVLMDEEKPVLFSYPCFHCAKKIDVTQIFCSPECKEKCEWKWVKTQGADHE